MTDRAREAVAELEASILTLSAALETDDRAAIAAAARAVEVDAMHLRVMFQAGRPASLHQGDDQ